MMFRREPLTEIIDYLRGRLADAPSVTIRVPVAPHAASDSARTPNSPRTPDSPRDNYPTDSPRTSDSPRASDSVRAPDAVRAHPLRTWVDLADRLDTRLAVRDVDLDCIELVFQKLDADGSTERVSKLEDPSFVIDFGEALERVTLPVEPRVLDLGVGTGDELVLIRKHLPGASIVAVDRDAAAVATARERFADVDFVEADLGRPLSVGAFDLVVAIAVLQSSELDDRDLLRRIVQDHLAPQGAVIFGVPNCRYLDGEQRYGARMKNFSQPELGLLVKDVAFYRKYLQQHDRQVFVTGKHYILVTGTMI